MTRVLDYFKEVSSEPDIPHEWTCKSWESARRLAYQIRQGMHASQFHVDLAYIYEMKASHIVRLRDRTVVIEPRFSSDSVVRITPLPVGAEYANTRKSSITFPLAEGVLGVILSLRTLPLEAPWKEVLFPKIDFDSFSDAHKKVIWEMAKELTYEIMAIESLVLVRLGVESLLVDLVYTPGGGEK